MKPDFSLRMGRLTVAICFVLVPLCLPSVVSAEVLVTLADDSTLSAPGITFENGNLVLSDGKVLPREQVKKILYLKGTKGWRYEPAVPNPDEYKAYLEEGKRLAETYPGFEAYDVEDRNVFTWNPDGTTTWEARSIVYLAKEDAKKQATRAFGLEEERNRYAFLALRSISKDLKIRDVQPERIVTAPTDSSTYYFNHYLTISCQIPDPEVGGLIETHTVEEVYNPPDKNWWDTQNYFQGTRPTARSSLTVRVPEGKKVNYYQNRMPKDLAKPAVTTAKGFTEYKWATGEMRAIIMEPYSPPLGEVVPFVLVSPFFDREYLYDLENRLIGDHTEPDARVRAATEKIIEGATSDDEKAARIYHYLQKNIRYISIKGGIGSGYGGHPAWLTLENRFGDCIDKAILFTAMLATCGIEAEVAILQTRGGEQLMDKLPILSGNHAITRVTVGGRSFYLDSTGSMLRYPSLYSGDQGVVSDLPRSRKIETIPPVATWANQNRHDYRIVMDKDGGLKMDAVDTFTGHIEARIRGSLTGIKEKDRREQYMRKAANLSPGGELAGFRDEGVDDLSKPVASFYSFNLPDYVNRSGKLMFFKLPHAAGSFNTISLPERKIDLEIYETLAEEKNYDVELPPGYLVRLVPAPLELHTPWYDVKAAYEVKDRRLSFHYRYDQKLVRVSVSDYRAYREGLLKVEQFTNEKIFLDSGEGGAR